MSSMTGLSKRRWFPRVSYQNFGDPLRKPAFRRWFVFQRFWAGRLWCFSVRHHQITLDFRVDWLHDIAHGLSKKGQ